LFSFQEDGPSENEMDEEVMKPIWDLTDLTKKVVLKVLFLTLKIDSGRF